MNFNPFKLKTNSWFLISAIILMVAFYLFYFEFYVKNNEENIITAHFRALDQMGVNIDKKLNVYINNANDLARKVKSEWESVNGYPLNEAKQRLADTLNKKGDFNKNIRVVDFIRGVDEESYLQALKSRSLRQNYYFTVKLADSPFYKQKSDNGALMVLETRYDRLIKDLQRDDVFDGLIVVSDTNIVFNTIGQQLLFRRVAGTEIPETHYSLSSVPMLNSGRIMGGEFFNISISNIAYKAFIKPLKVNNNNWFAIGLIKTKNFNAASRSIEPWIIITLSMLLIFIILGLPVIKLKVLSATEQLDTKNIIDYALFVMLGGAFTAMFLSFMVQNHTHRQSINYKLARLSHTIDSAFRDEIDKAYLQLEYYDSSYIALSNTAHSYNLEMRINILSEKEPYFPKFYPFGDYYFWTNPKGIQTDYLTPINTEGKMSDLSSRDYINKKDEWFYPGSREKKFRMQSIVSITSGTAKAAISKRGAAPQRPVVAVSTKMYSIINTILPMNYAFCIIDQSGKVWFHSNQNMNLKENFIEECNNNNYLKAAMYANISKTINVNYYNNACRIHIKRLDNLPLYLITIFNKKSEKSFQAEVITFTLLFIGILLFVIFLQILALLIIEILLKHTFSRNLLVKLTKPIKRLNSRYRYLIKLNLILSLISIIFLFFFSDMVAVISMINLTIIFFTYSYWLLNKGETKESHKKWFSVFNVFMFVTVTSVGLIVVPNKNVWQMFLFDAVIALTILFAHLFLYPKTSDNGSYWTNYTLLLVTILFMMGITPVLKFYEIGYNNESEIRARHKLLDLKRQKEERNTTILGFYNNINPSSHRDSIIKARENLGIYTEFDDDIRYLHQWNMWSKKTIAENSRWDSLYCYIRPFYDKSIIENKYLPLKTPLQNNILWFSSKNRIALKYNSLTEHITQSRIKPYFITTAIKRMSFVTPFKTVNNSISVNILLNIVFWLLILLTLYVFYRLLKFGLYRIFNHDIINNYVYQSYDKKLQYLLNVNRNVFVVRQSQTDETEIFPNKFLSSDERRLITWITDEDIIKTEDRVDTFINELKTRYSADVTPEIYIAGFETDFINLSLLNKKLEVLKHLLTRKDIKLIVLSNIGIDVIIESYKLLLSELSESGKKDTIYVEVIKELNYIHSVFATSYIPVNCQEPHLFERGCKKEPQTVDVDGRIENELTACNYLLQLTPAVTEFKDQCCSQLGDSFPEEIITDKILALAEKFYEEIFNSCTAQEKYLLLDFAHDSILNPKNEKVIYNLLDKGLLVRRCDKINLMNKSFRKFLISKLSMVKMLESELSKDAVSGTWHGYRVTLILIIISLFAFITMANQDFLDNLNRLFVAIGGGVAVITGVVGLLSHKRKATKS